MKGKVHHPIFARMLKGISTRALERGGEEHRREMLEGLSGRVVEVGAGTGVNFSYYPESVSEVVAVEPERYLRSQAEEAASSASANVRVVDGLADQLPFEDASFDAGIASLLLCSVPDQSSALTELARVIRPAGELRFFEHVRSKNAGLARLQSGLDYVWPFFFGGCHLSRNTSAGIERAGFTIESCREFDFKPVALAFPEAPHIVGVARRT